MKFDTNTIRKLVCVGDICDLTLICSSFEQNNNLILNGFENLDYNKFLKKLNKLEMIEFIYNYFENPSEVMDMYSYTLLNTPLKNTKCILTRDDAVLPHKASPGDSGYDLTLIDVAKTIGKVTLYNTGVKVQPPFGYYYDLVPRSSIIKSGYMLANSVGIIDQGYTGEILVPLIKIDPDAPDLELPIRLVQLIPRQWIHMQFNKTDDFEDTSRSDGGFGSSGKL